MVYVSDDVKSTRRCDLEGEDMEVMWIQVKMKKRHVLIGNVYRPPKTPAVWMDNLTVMLEKVTQERMPVIVIGDFNCNMLNPDSCTRTLTMVMSQYGLDQLIGCPTRVTQSSETQIDLLFSTNPDTLVHTGCKGVGLSDHDMIYGIVKGNADKQKQCVREVRALDRCDVDRLVADLRSAPWWVMKL